MLRWGGHEGLPLPSLSLRESRARGEVRVMREKTLLPDPTPEAGAASLTLLNPAYRELERHQNPKQSQTHFSLPAR